MNVINRAIKVSKRSLAGGKFLLLPNVLFLMTGVFSEWGDNERRILNATGISAHCIPLLFLGCSTNCGIQAWSAKVVRLFPRIVHYMHKGVVQQYKVTMGLLPLLDPYSTDNWFKWKCLTRKNSNICLTSNYMD